MKRFLLMLSITLLVLVNRSKSAEIEFSFSPFQINSKPKVYLNKNIEQFCQRINFSSAVEINEIEIGFFSNKKNTSATLKIYGEEGQQSVPRTEIEIIDSILISKKNKGFEKIKISLPKSLSINDLQFFISISNLSDGLYIITDDNPNEVLCENPLDIFTGQYLKDKDEVWHYSKFNYDISIKGKYIQKDEIKYFFNSITDSILNKVDLDTINNQKFSNLTIFDIDKEKDWKNEIIVNNFYFKYNSKIKKYEVSSLSERLLKNSILNYVCDYDLDGKIDVLQILEEIADNKYKKYQLRLITNFSDKNYKVIEQDLIDVVKISSVQQFDLNNDNYMDLIITQTDTIDQIPNIILQNTGKSFKEIQIYDNKNISYNGTYSMITKNIDKKGWFNTLAIFDDKGKFDLWEIKDNFQIKSVEYKGKYNNRTNDEDSTISLINDYDLIYNYSTEENEIITTSNVIKIEKQKPIKSLKFKNSKSEEKIDKFNNSENQIWCIGSSGLKVIDINNDMKDDVFYFVNKECYNNYLYVSNNSNVSDNYEIINRDITDVGANFGKDGIFCDYNDDGKLDLFTFKSNQIQILENIIENQNNWITLKDSKNELLKNGDNVKVYLRDETIEKEICLNNSWYFQSPYEIHIGLNENKTIDSVIITDNKGINYLFKDIKTNAINVLPETRNIVNDIYSVEFTSYPNPFTSDSKIKIQANIFKSLKIVIEDINGNEIRELFKDKQKDKLIELDWDGKDKNNQLVNTGIYFIVLKYKNLIFSHKIVKN